jgi:primosomal protein N' (replication factor Y)
LEHKAAEEIDKQSGFFAQALRKELGSMVLGPTMPPVTRIKGWYIRNILIKMDRDKADISGIKNFLRDKVDEAMQKTEFKGLRISLNVDP